MGALLQAASIVGAILYFLGWMHYYYYFEYFAIPIESATIPFQYFFIHAFAVVKFTYSLSSEYVSRFWHYWLREAATGLDVVAIVAALAAGYVLMLARTIGISARLLWKLVGWFRATSPGGIVVIIAAILWIGHEAAYLEARYHAEERRFDSSQFVKADLQQYLKDVPEFLRFNRALLTGSHIDQGELTKVPPRGSGATANNDDGRPVPASDAPETYWNWFCEFAFGKAKQSAPAPESALTPPKENNSRKESVSSFEEYYSVVVHADPGLIVYLVQQPPTAAEGKRCVGRKFPITQSWPEDDRFRTDSTVVMIQKDLVVTTIRIQSACRGQWSL